MSRRNSGAVVQQIHTLLNIGSLIGFSDRQLLDLFVSRQEEESEIALTLLIERHGPMVLGVCRRILVDPHDAEEAFQATFLILVRKAGSVRVDGSVGPWLFGVATRVARRAGADASRRRRRERSGLERLKIVAAHDHHLSFERAELQSILVEEISRLPSRLQAAVVLCDLEGCSNEQAAKQLGWAAGTVKSRRSRARDLLRQRLTRRGLAAVDLSTSLPLLPMSLSGGLTDHTIRAARSLSIGRLTTVGMVSASVTCLTEGVIRTMFWTNTKLGLAAAALIMSGSVAVFSQAPPTKVGHPYFFEPRGLKGEETAPDSSRNHDELDLHLLERAWADAIYRRDTAIVNRILADNFEGTDAAGNLFTKGTYLTDLKNGVFSTQRIELEEVKPRLFGDAALVTSRLKIAGHLTTVRLTNFYVWRTARWQCVASHASGIDATRVLCPVTGSMPKTSVPPYTHLIETKEQTARPGYLGNNCVTCHTVIPQVGIDSGRKPSIDPTRKGQ